MKYSDFVNYDLLDPFKEESLRRFRRTLSFPKGGVSILEESLGETAVVIDMGRFCDFYLAFNVEGLGTKNKIAEKMLRLGKNWEIDGRKLFSGLGQCSMAMSLNDLSSVGAAPFVYGPIVSTGDSAYVNDEKKAAGIIDGFENGAKISGVAIPCGETPTLKGIIGKETLDLSGASIGIISPKSRLTLGEDLESGLSIYGVSSSGIHANGVSLARAISEKLKDGYFTKLPSGRTLGEVLLTPTTLYAPFVESLFENGVDIKYMQPITGHGWGKIMRKKKNLRYVIENLPEPQEEFTFLQKKGDVSDEEAYKTWNMGIGWIVFAPIMDAGRIDAAGKKNGLKVYELGRTEKGDREVVLRRKNIVYRAK